VSKGLCTSNTIDFIITSTYLCNSHPCLQKMIYVKFVKLFCFQISTLGCYVARRDAGESSRSLLRALMTYKLQKEFTLRGRKHQEGKPRKEAFDKLAIYKVFLSKHTHCYLFSENKLVSCTSKYWILGGHTCHMYMVLIYISL